jgi:menaquinone-dependent protoporphyrinogen oxidase
MEDLRILVAYASVHGSTAEIARSISLTLARAGIDVDVLPVAEVQSVSDYDAVVLGSAVYGGRWRKDAYDFIERFGLHLAQKDLWLFQSGPLGRSAQYIVRALPASIATLAQYLHVKGVATFGGRLQERAGLVGDYRDFTEIRLWAEDVARTTAMDVVMGKSARGNLPLAVVGGR